MNILIAGGLLAFAIVAILVAVFLGLGEQRSERARANRASATSSAAPAAAVTPPASSVPAAPAASVPMPEQPAQVSKPLRRTVPLNSEHSMPLERPVTGNRAYAGQEELPYFAMNGQMREMAEELRSLHQQSWELEQRLLALTEMLDRTERTQSRQLSIDEEVTQEHFPADSM